jgi:hypothetical protein
MNELYEYLHSPNDPMVNFNLGLFYEHQGHYSPASTFYLRAAEKTDSLDLRYEVLIRTFSCYNSLGNRNHTCESLLKQAICLCPKKPEAYYFLSKLYESKSDWLNMYTYSNIALDVCTENSTFVHPVQYPGLYAFLFQKAASAWWVGKPFESRQILRLLIDNYLDQLDNTYKGLLESNIVKIGLLPEKDSVKPYTKNNLSKLKYSFQNLEDIDRNFSQAYQDIFVLSVLNGKMNGSYLEIGSSDPYKNNNTALLENKFAWTGIGLEYEEHMAQTYKKHRKNPVLCVDALIVDYEKLLQKYFPNLYNIDYLQLDIDPPKNTYEILLSIPFDKYRFAVITYEHDYYIDLSKSYRNKSREYLTLLGYELLIPNVSPNENSPFEDWWVHPELVSKDVLSSMKISDLISTNKVESILLKN